MSSLIERAFVGSFTKLTYHIVFGTKYRRPTICRDFRERLYDYLGGTIRGVNGSLIEVGGVEDHLHLLANLPPTNALSDMVRDIKACSSKWVNDLPECKARFEWKKGYGAFTVSHSQIGVVQNPSHQITPPKNNDHQRQIHRQELEQRCATIANKCSVPVVCPRCVPESVVCPRCVPESFFKNSQARSTQVSCEESQK